MTPTQPVGSEFSLPVFKLDCLTDPGAISGTDVEQGALPDDCTLAGGVEFDVTADGEVIEPDDPPFVTGPNGAFIIITSSGVDLEITEDETTATDGFAPRDNPIVVTNVDPDTAPVVFVNLPTRGGVEVIKRICTVDDERDTRITVTEAGAAGSAATDCAGGPGIDFTIDGDALPEPIKVTTNPQGKLMLDLPPGDYTIVEDASGASAEFTVVAERALQIVVINFEIEDDPEDPDPPVKDLPKTGAGPGSSTDARLGLIALLGLLALGSAAHALRRHLLDLDHAKLAR